AAVPCSPQASAPAEVADAMTIVHGRPYVLTVGVLSPMKNLVPLLRAFASSALPRRDTRLVLAGPDREGYGDVLRREARRLGVAEPVAQPGFGGGAEVPSAD